MSNNFVFVTDNGSDLSLDYMKKHDIGSMQLSYTIDDVTYMAYDQDPKDFYAVMRKGKMPITAQVNVKDALSFFEPYLKEGKDIFYLAFSSGLSGTYNSGSIAAKDLREKYPDRKLIVVDSLCASMGQGLLVHKANEMRENGASIEEVEAFCLKQRNHVIHMVAADDLMHLHRGGRVSKTSAIAGSLLGIKPMIVLNGEGKLVSVGKVRGRKQSLVTMVDMAEKMKGDFNAEYVSVCHSDCEEDARFVEQLAKKRFGVKQSMVNYIGTVIGSHTGPGTVALSIYGQTRNYI